MILVTGATGGLGSAVIDTLLENTSAQDLAVLVRDKQKGEHLAAKGISVRYGDYDDYQSLVKAFTGIKKLLLVSAPAVSHERLERESNAINAAIEAGVKHIFFTGIQQRKDADYIIPWVTEGSRQIESLIKESGMAYTIVENTIYSDSLPLYAGEKVLEDGFYFPSGNGKIAFALRSELGEAIAKLLLQDGHENQTYTLTNSESWSFAEIASMISEVSGKEIRHKDVSKQEFLSYRLAFDPIPEVYLDFFAEWAAATKNGEFAHTDPMLEKMLGRKPSHLREFIADYYGKSKA